MKKNSSGENRCHDKDKGMEALILRLGHVDVEKIFAQRVFDYAGCRQTGLEEAMDVAALSQIAQTLVNRSGTKMNGYDRRKW